jgi:hypothetical protein
MFMKQLKSSLAPIAWAVALVGLGCATSTTEQPAAFKGPPQPTAVWAISPDGAFPDVLVWASDDTRPQTAKPPPTHNRFRIEFNQPLDATTVANNLDLIANTTTLTYTFCTPTSNSVQLIDAANPAAPIVSSVCYDPTSAIGGNPKIVVVPGAGAVNPAVPPTQSALTCQAFAPVPTTETLKQNHAYQLKMSTAVKGISGAAFQSPNGRGWDGAGTFNFTTDGFETLGVGYASETSTTFYWLDKLPGYQSGVPATPGDQQIACDFSFTDATQKPCRMPTDGNQMLVITTLPVDPASAKAAVTLTRKDGTVPDTQVTTSNGNRVIRISTGNFWEPDTTYVLTVGAGVHAADGTPLATPKTYTFTANSSPTKVVTVSPDRGSNANSLATDTVELTFSNPVDLTGASITVKDPNGAVVSGPPEIVAKSADQVVDVPITGTLATATTYTISAIGPGGAGVKGFTTQSGTKAPLTFPPFTSTFRTQEFTVAGLFNAAGDTELDGSNTVPPETLVNGDLNAVFVTPTTPATVSPSSVQLFESGKQITATVTPSADGSTATVKVSDPNFPVKFKTPYRVDAATAIKDAAGKSLHAEGCSGTDCPASLAFTTLAFTPTISVSRTTGVFTLTFPAPLDPAAISEFLTGTNKMFFILPENFTVDPNTGAHVRTPDASKPVAVSCALASGNTKISCTPTAPLPANKYFLASAVFFQTKTAGVGGPAVVLSPQSINGTTVNFDKATGTFFGTRTVEFITPCP